MNSISPKSEAIALARSALQTMGRHDTIQFQHRNGSWRWHTASNGWSRDKLLTWLGFQVEYFFPEPTTMPYNYQTERPKLFTEEGQVTFLKIRDRAKMLINLAGCARMEEIIQDCTGSSWTMLACVDRLVELRELKEIPQENVAGQNRIFK